ncbi:MAG TPA: HD domain-containing protein [Nitrososphaera sp.]|jgi:uncharacterized protein
MLEDIRKEVEAMLAGRDPGHDMAHIERVYVVAEQIGREEGADLEILLSSALLHDLVVHPKGSKERSRSADDSADLAEKMLQARGWKKDRVDRVVYCIRSHSYSKNVSPATLEARVLQDADRLDALGAVGIARTFSVGGLEMRRFYNPEDPFCRTGREPEDRKWTLDHFKAKLLKLEGTMHTASARRMARERTRFMEAFLSQLEKEISHSP